MPRIDKYFQVKSMMSNDKGKAVSSFLEYTAFKYRFATVFTGSKKGVAVAPFLKSVSRNPGLNVNICVLDDESSWRRILEKLIIAAFEAAYMLDSGAIEYPAKLVVNAINELFLHKYGSANFAV